ncbi:HK97 gp10 family phage protein [Streptomyces sp. NPDC037389]|uniref:HK97 gp10 family phage protein n=1 Tax=Streptomyces sp. NPDC037389 TaxID=3155369 RepID=UPI003410E4FB
MPPQVKINRAGLRQLLNSSMITAALVLHAEEIKAVAEATAPVDSGTYKASFEVWARRRMGVRKDRTGAVVLNTARHARFVEYGGDGAPAHHTLLRAATSGRGT